MTDEEYDFEATFTELKKSSQVSLIMVILGALALIGSIIYSATRLAPLEEEISQKSVQIEKLAATEREYLNKTQIAKTQYEQLKTNIEKLYAVKVTANNNVYELKATAKASGPITNNLPRYDFSIFINTSKTTLTKIRNVTYLFDHPSFEEKIFVSENAAERFMISYQGWGCLTRVSATIELIDGESQQIDFNMCQSLGPQWIG
jgi:hypothetical protein